MGFIHDKLDIKFLILYLMARVAGPVDFTTLADLTFCDDGVEYFDFAESVAELVSTGHLAVEGDLYTITDKGRRNGEICESSLAFSVRQKVRPEPGQGQRGAPPQRPSPVGTPSPGGWGVTLRLILDDDKGNLMTLDLLAVSEDQANQLADQFRLHPETLYENILQTLLGEPPL